MPATARSTLRTVATTRRDYYEVLGVPRTADERAIKTAFRRLARELHPDVSDHPEAQERFREAAEAYEVLSKAETRELYDRYGHDGLCDRRVPADRFRLRQPRRPVLGVLRRRHLRRPRRAPGPAVRARRRRPRRGRDRARRGGEGRDARRSRSRSSPTVRRAGNGAAPGTTPETCPRCEGTGRLQSVSNSFFGQVVRTQACPGCGGPGEVVETPCADCGGVGPDRGGARARGRDPAGHPRRPADPRSAARATRACSAGGPATSTCIVHVRPDPRFVRDGQRHRLDGRPHDDPGGPRRHAQRPDAGRRARARVRARNAAGRGPRAAGQGHAGPPGPRPRRPPGARERRRPAPPHGRAAPAARGVRARANTSATTGRTSGFFERLRAAFR